MPVTLMVSYNLGISYDPVFIAESVEDEEFQKQLKYARDNYLRYYVEGDKSIICPQHTVALTILGCRIPKGHYRETTIEEKAEKLKKHFCHK